MGFQDTLSLFEVTAICSIRLVSLTCTQTAYLPHSTHRRRFIHAVDCWQMLGDQDASLCSASFETQFESIVMLKSAGFWSPVLWERAAVMGQ